MPLVQSQETQIMANLGLWVKKILKFRSLGKEKGLPVTIVCKSRGSRLCRAPSLHFTSDLDFDEDHIV